MIFESPSARHEANSATGAATVATVFVISLLYLTLCMNRSVNVFDEGLVLFGAARVATKRPEPRLIPKRPARTVSLRKLSLFLESSASCRRL